MKKCANCLHFEGDTETTWLQIRGRLRQVYLHRCQIHPDRTDAEAEHPECFESRAAAEFKAHGFDKPVKSTARFSQGTLL